MSQGSCHRAVQRDEPWLRQILAPLRLTGSDLHLCILLASLHELGIRVGASRCPAKPEGSFANSLRTPSWTRFNEFRADLGALCMAGL